MNNIIRSALRNPIAVVVGMLAIVFFSWISLTKIPVDIFPALDLPTIYVAEPYGGLAPDQLDGFVAAQYQNNFLYVSGIKNIELKSIQGLTLIKLSFYPGTNMAQASSEVANQVNRARALMPAGTLPPQVVRFDASSVPIGELVFQSQTKTLNEVQDAAASRIRPMFSTIQGVSSPPPFGGNQRTIVVKVNPDQLRSHNLTPEEVVRAIAANNQPSAAGNIRVGRFAYMTPVNSLIKNPQEFLDIPVKTGSGPAVYIRDIASVEDAADVTVGYAEVNGKRAVYIPVIKKSDASTLDVVNNIKAAMPRLQAAIPQDIHISYEFDQSVYVVQAIRNLATEGGLGALLTGLMVLLFLRDWRSVIIVVLTIPLSILSAIILLNMVGQTINIMTLSGLALAIGVLVDQATVTIENIHQHLEMGKPKSVAIWEACKEIVFPEFLILLCIIAVFAPAFIMEGIPKSMFLPLSLSVGFAMIASFLLAQTFVPVLANWMLKSHVHGHEHATLALGDRETEKVMDEDSELHDEEARLKAHDKSKKISGFDKFKIRYNHLLVKLQQRQKVLVTGYLLVAVLIIIACFHFIGTDILPKTNSAQFQVRLREPDGTRIERTEDDLLGAIAQIKKLVGSENIEITSAYVGGMPSSYAISSIFTFTSGPHEAVLQVALDENAKIQLDPLKEKIRSVLAKVQPQLKISFEPIELTEKIMSQGSTTPIEISIGAKDVNQAYSFSQNIIRELKKISFLRDIQIAQPLKYPAFNIHINRELAGQLGLTSTDVTKSMITATSSSRFTDKNLWLDPKSGLGYQVQVQIPENQMTKENDLEDIPLKAGQSRPALTDVANISQTFIPGEIDREGSNRLVTITANIYGKDLGTAGTMVDQAIANAGAPPRGVTVKTKGQVTLLKETLSSLQSGLVLAIVVIFLMLTANFKSFKLSLAILSTVPAVIVGSLLMLLLCGATLNLQSYMGMIMSVGVSVANAILMITNAENVRLVARDSNKAALMAANSRIRPILMTSLAMIAGMIPMASSGEQVAPLGQAVIGGLIMSTLASLLLLPNVFGWIQKKTSLDSVSLDPEDENSKFYHQSHQVTHN
ncbi:efflux RND transporter permease subunit [Mucilaginibacter rubeus]|uniref:Efflux RND transporter permease subunit n=1 Tax=Mucilaginibacter rubeus TaxID=2027860 RepID=A0AAE6MKQ1_9SPHI|nr:MULTISPECIES: efflux RND transporter permease subunit [Mucilaginibacter]QEM06457.1 efflux RND transporter permease subunit [Mucilaginibacter rubeus]QEM19043.1 efflux RND transporter permease subunit [Mucilaginibacter gossypii]QTE44416.1 efflux RND transporter permease subunit [Mucilaginibacter rubeus]QTE51015.1 efflux RND transporter permease subunit [Mucilaginibacter rubeus]QTE56098.1 efflux RND transporter permease subunit [Mucilaginibacter rubeus]